MSMEETAPPGARIFDQTSDMSGRDTYRILKLLELPEFVKAASSDDSRGPATLMPPSAYADPRLRQFPVHTKAAVWLSTAFFLKNQSDINPKIASYIDGTLEKMASFHGISSDIRRLRAQWRQKFDPADKALTDDDFALLLKRADGSVEPHYPMRNAREVRAAAEYLYRWRDAIPYDDRVMMARKIQEKAASFGANTEPHADFLDRQAGHGGCAPLEASQLLWNRVHCIGRLDKPNQTQIELAKLAQACLKHPHHLDGDALVKLASLVYQADAIHGVEYSELVPRPEDVLFQFTKKMASEFMAQHIKTTSGKVYKVADFRKVRLDDLRDMMGQDFASAVSTGGVMVSPDKMAEVVPTLPRTDAELLDRLFEDVGITPLAAKEASSSSERRSNDSGTLGSRLSMTRQELLHLAARRR